MLVVVEEGGNENSLGRVSHVREWEVWRSTYALWEPV